MNNLLWIKNLYAQNEIKVPSKKMRILGSLVATMIGLAVFIKTGFLLPLLFSVVIITVSLIKPLAEPFFKLLLAVLFLVLQTVTLIMLAMTFIAVLIPIAILNRIFNKSDSFFKTTKRSTFEEPEAIDVKFERQF